MRHLKPELEKLAECLVNTITTYEESRKFVAANFSPKEYMQYCMELDRLKEMNENIKQGINTWFNGIIVELKVMLEDVLKYEKT